jgi:glucose 1-dehydrogenase
MKRVLITGGGTGIGRATALEFAGRGFDVAINYFRSDEQARAVAEKICAELQQHECRTLLLQADVSQENEVREMFAELLSSWGGVDVLVNNSGIQEKSPSHQLELSSFEKVMSTNARGTFLCCREALKLFLSQGIKGVIVNNTSVHEQIPKPGYLAYSMSKGAIANLTKTLALEYAARGIRINSVAPGAIATPINPWAKDEAASEQVSAHIPMGRIGQSEEIARAIAFLASEEAGYVTGQTLFVDGGLILYPEFAEDWSSDA